MAFGARQISPIDFNKSAAVGVDLPFSAPGVFKSNYTTAAATKNNLINFFLTNPGERPLNPTFGAGLRSFVFQQITNNNLSSLENGIEKSLISFFPNIYVDNLSILSNPDTNLINIILKYGINQTSIQDTLQINFNG